ncbi:MAG: bifunctional ornithine acetyltransferase/N-acetylglutamate synthase, partial [Anaerovorax sp.]
EPMTMDPFERGIPKAVKKLSYTGSDSAAHGIMTTDTVKKEISVSFILDNKECHIGGIAKGSGMINPNMATMLCFLTSDVAIDHQLLQEALSADILDTFNQISIDGDTSTNDTVAILANGMAGNVEITEKGESYALFCQALGTVTAKLSRGVAKDGEGATKLLECIVSGAPDLYTARTVSKAV